jgi:oligopeptide transport system substrate-binding protein
MRTSLTKYLRPSAIAIVVVAAFCLIAAPVGATSLHRGVSSEPRSLDPHFALGNSDATIVMDLFEGLVTQDAAGRPIPGAAQNFTVNEAGTLYTFKLRPGLTWSDGMPLEASDFEYAYKRIVDPDNATMAARYMGFVKNASQILARKSDIGTLGVRAIDSKTIEIELEEAVPYFAEVLSHYSLAPVPRHVVEEHGQRWTAPENIVVNGPYRMTERVSNTYLKSERNDLYYDSENVEIDEVYYYPIENTAAGLKRFRAGELDILRNVPSDQLDWVSDNYPGQLRRDPIAALAYLILNNDETPTNDVNVRKALSLSIDRIALTDLLIKDATGPAYNVVPPELGDYGVNRPDYADLSKEELLTDAKSLLAAAGYDESRPLGLELKYGGQEKARRMAVAVQGMWKEIGIDVTLVNVGGQAVVQDAKSGDFQAMRYFYFAPLPDPIVFLNLLKTDHLSNYSKYTNNEYDSRLIAADKIFDKVRRLEALRSAEAMALQDFPVIPLYFNAQYALVEKHVAGWEDNLKGDHLSRFLKISDD